MTSNEDKQQVNDIIEESIKIPYQTYSSLFKRFLKFGFLAGIGFMLPGFLLMFALSWLYFQFSLQASVFGAAFLGMQPVVAALIIRAVHRIGGHAIYDKTLFLIASLSFLVTLAGIPFWFPLIFGGISYALFRSLISRVVLHR